MSDLREVFMGKTRSQIDDAHSVKMFSIYAKRAEMMNSLLSLLIVATLFALIASVTCLVALVIWVWQVLL